MRSSCWFLGLALLTSCFNTTLPYQLPLNGLAARSTFPRLAMCAKARNLQPSEQGDTMSVPLDGETSLQYLIHGEHYSMVITLDSSLSEADRSSRGSAARTLGNELFGCSMGNGVITPPSTDLSGTGPGSLAAVACHSAAGPTCIEDGQCESQNCSGSICQSRDAGSLCRLDAHCDSRSCVDGCCQPRTAGSLCGGQDNHCNSLNCTSGRCQSRSVGALCGGQDSHCDSLNCTNGRCQPRSPGAICGTADSHCESFRCEDGVCK